MRYWPDDEDMVVVSREPIHPGGILREEYMEDLALSVARLAEHLGVSQQTVNEVVQQRRGLSFDMCLRSGRLFRASPEFWMNLQRDVDMWESLALNGEDMERTVPIEAKEPCSSIV